MKLAWINCRHTFERREPQTALAVFQSGGLIAVSALDARHAVARVEHLIRQLGQHAVRHLLQILSGRADHTAIGAKPEETEIIVDQTGDFAGWQTLFLRDFRPGAGPPPQQAES